MAALVTAVAALAAPAFASAAATIQPGAYHDNGSASCTLNFIYDGAGGTYAGTAAHCADRVGQPMYDIDGVQFGTVAYIGDADVTQRDYAFIRIDSEDLGRVSPAVKGYPQYPTGSTVPAETASGDQVQISGYGLGFDTNPVTQEKRRAVLTGDDTQLHHVVGPIDWGDSGGPLVHIPTGKALGTVSRLCVGTICSEEGPTVQGILADAAAHNFAVTLRTV